MDSDEPTIEPATTDLEPEGTASPCTEMPGYLSFERRPRVAAGNAGSTDRTGAGKPSTGPSGVRWC